ncbi:hypothetical protein KSH_03235 [Moraxella osloensis]|nr:hypothetical protein [Moraxella osloensis]ATQ84900.1 hypothetical protein KSH_03235 [Moraxella osloensis]
MTHRSAPFVAPNLHLTQSDVSDHSDNGNPSALLVDEKAHKKQVKLLLSTLQADIAQFRDNFFPPPYLTQIQDLPIYAGNLAEVQSYEQTWQALIDRAKGFYPSAGLPPDYLPLPASLEIPQFIYHVQKLHLTRTKAKESKNFGSVGALVEKCGPYEDAQLMAMENALAKGEDVRLVAHREFIDLRAYVFCRNPKGELLEPERIRFYRTGLVIQTLADFKVVDSRQTPRKKRNDAYKNAIADNGIWKIFVKN